MTTQDTEKFKRLTSTMLLNARVRRLYATYLNEYPELITAEMIDALTADGDIDKGDAVCALLCEAFGLDDGRGGEERRIIREYIRPSVQMLDARRYTENKYYKNIKIPSVTEEGWELRWECYPPYRAFVCGDLIIKPDFSEIAPLGFFDEEFRFPAVLEGGNEWMTLSPVDIDTCEADILAAHGRVLTFGLGLGYYAYMCSEKENVDSVTVVERSREVIALFKKYILPQFPRADKIRIIESDAVDYAREVLPREKYDYIFVDFWRDGGDGYEGYKLMRPYEKKSSAPFSYWIINFITSQLRQEKFEDIYRAVSLNMRGAPSCYAEILERLR